MKTYLNKIIVIVLIIISFNVFAQNNYNLIEKQARKNLFNLKFSKSTELLINSKSKTSYYLISYNLFLQNLLIGGDENYKKFEKQFKISSEFIENSKDDSLKLPYLSEIYLQNAIIKLLNRDFISGALSFIESFGYFKNAEENYPKSFYNLKLSALFNIIAGITPDKGKIFLSAVGLNGDIKLGIEQMNSYVLKSEKRPIYHTEAYIINKLIISYLKEDVGNINLKNLKNNLELNSLNIFSNILIEYKEHNYSNTNNDINKLRKQNISGIPYLYYLSGIINSATNSEKANKNLKLFLSKNKSKHFIKSTYWQLARIAILQNNIEMFNLYKVNTIEKGSAFTDADKQAFAEAKLPEIPNKLLLKSRLLFDAGNYLEAKTILLKKENKKLLKTNDEITEFFYRLARIYYALEDYEKAKKYYKLVLKKQLNSKRYFAPYSALQLGIIYDNENNKIEAKKYYEIAIEINNGEYKNSIKHKAESRLKDL